IEPTGSHFGSIPTPPAFVAALREETRRAGALLIFDEVVTGFRVAPGGAQEKLGIRPDLTTMAKILCGGLPGGACAGRADVMGYLSTKSDPAENRRAKIAHAGTFNANPLSAAAGVAMLSTVADGQAIRFANQQAAKLRHGMNETLAREKVAWKIYGEHSDWKIYFGADAPPRDGSDQSVANVDWRRRGHRPHAGRRGGLRHRWSELGPDLAGCGVYRGRRPGQDHSPARHQRYAERDRHPARPSVRLRPGLSCGRRHARRDRSRPPHPALRARAGDHGSHGGGRVPDLALHEPARHPHAATGDRDRPPPWRAGDC